MLHVVAGALFPVPEEATLDTSPTFSWCWPQNFEIGSARATAHEPGTLQHVPSKRLDKPKVAACQRNAHDASAGRERQTSNVYIHTPIMNVAPKINVPKV